MKKDTRLTFRVESRLKEALQTVAAKEGRSVAQICEAFLKAGVDEFERRGSDHLRRYLARLKTTL